MNPILVFAAIMASLAALSILILPRRLVRPGLTSDGVERRKLQNEIVRTIAESVAGVFFLVTAIFTWQEIQAGKTQIRNAQDQLEVARQGQITERFTRAIDQLGDNEVNVRVGAIYALERIARDSPPDSSSVMEVLSAFLRERAPVNTSIDTNIRKARGSRAVADVQAAVTVLGRRNRDNEAAGNRCSRLGGPSFPCVLNLERVDLTGADLSGGNFDRVNLRGARLSYALLAFGSFRGADLGSTDLRLVNFRLADLTEASLLFSRLESTNMHLVKGLTCEQLKQSASPSGAANLTIKCPPWRR